MNKSKRVSCVGLFGWDRLAELGLGCLYMLYLVYKYRRPLQAVSRLRYHRSWGRGGLRRLLVVTAACGCCLLRELLYLEAASCSRRRLRVVRDWGTMPNHLGRRGDGNRAWSRWDTGEDPSSIDLGNDELVGPPLLEGTAECLSSLLRRRKSGGCSRGWSFESSEIGHVLKGSWRLPGSAICAALGRWVCACKCPPSPAARCRPFVFAGSLVCVCM